MGGSEIGIRKKRLSRHCGSMTSLHKMAQEKYNSSITPKRSIADKFSKINETNKIQYMSRLSYSIQCAKYLLQQGLASRGHDESESSLKGKFLRVDRYAS